MVYHIKKIASVIMGFSLIIAIILACSKDDGKDPKSQTLECSLIELGSQSIFPTEKVFINNIDESLKDKLTAEFWYDNAFTGISMNVGVDENEKSFIIAPIHPELPLEGGDIQVVFKDFSGETICDPKLLTISQLPKAEGYTNQVVLGIQNLLDQRTTFLNIDEPVLSGNLATIEPTDVPFALLYNLLHNEDAEFALIPFLENNELWNTESVDKASSIDISDRLLNKYGVLDYINQSIKDFETKIAQKQSKNSLIKNSARCDGVNAEDLAFQMKSAANTEYSDPNTATGKYFTDLSNASTIAGFAGGKVGTAAAITGAIVFAIQKVEEGYSKTRLSHFTKLEYDIKTEFLEETACREPILKANAYAASDDWSMDKTIWESLLQFSSLLQLKIKGAPYEGKLEEFGLNLSSFFTTTQLNNLTNLGHWEDGLLKIEAIECGPIDVTSTKYIKGETLGTAFEVDNTSLVTIYPNDTGEDVLEVSLRPEFFAQQSISVSKKLTLTPIELKWVKPDKNPHTIKPGDIVNLEAHLKNTLNLDIKVSSPQGFLNPGQGVSLDSIQKYTLQTPTDESKYPFTVTAEFISDKCFRQSKYASPIMDGIIIDISKISVYTNDETCFQVGDFKDFDAIVNGDDKNVVWSAENESGQSAPITSQGGFTAPNEAGKYYIKAALQSNPEIFGIAEVEVVGSCTCYWNFTGGSFAMSYDQGWYTIQGDLTTGGVQINLYNDFYVIENEKITINMLSSFLPKEGETKTTSGMNDDDLASNLISINGLNFPGQSAVGGPLGTYSVTLKWKNQYLEGSITGTLFKSTLEGDIEFPFTLNFGANEGILSCDK